jgi:hypothetical protein
MVWAMAAMAMLQGGETIYVSPRGDDAWDGRAAVRRGASGPFRTVDRAVREVERLRMMKIQRYEPIRVVLRGGTYLLSKSLEIGRAAGGTPTSATVFEAYPKERPVLSGGVVLRGWQPDGQGRLRLRVPEAAGGAWRPLSLYVGERRLPRARLPKSGWFRVAEPLPPTGSASKPGPDRFRFRPGDLNASWSNLQDREVCAILIWGMARMRIRSIEGDVVNLTGGTGWQTNWAEFQKDGRYLIENAPEGLDEPGEWVLDSATGTFLAMPTKERIAFAPVAPRLERLVIVRDASHLSFRGLEFRHAAAPPASRGGKELAAGGIGPARRAAGGAIRPRGVPGLHGRRRGGLCDRARRRRARLRRGELPAVAARGRRREDRHAGLLRGRDLVGPAQRRARLHHRERRAPAPGGGRGAHRPEPPATPSSGTRSPTSTTPG